MYKHLYNTKSQMFHLNIIFKNHVHVHVYENTLLVSARFGLAMICGRFQYHSSQIFCENVFGALPGFNNHIITIKMYTPGKPKNSN